VSRQTFDRILRRTWIKVAAALVHDQALRVLAAPTGARVAGPRWRLADRRRPAGAAAGNPAGLEVPRLPFTSVPWTSCFSPACSSL